MFVCKLRWPLPDAPLAGDGRHIPTNKPDYMYYSKKVKKPCIAVMAMCARWSGVPVWASAGHLPRRNDGPSTRQTEVATELQNILGRFRVLGDSAFRACRGYYYHGLDQPVLNAADEIDSANIFRRYAKAHGASRCAIERLFAAVFKSQFKHVDACITTLPNTDRQNNACISAMILTSLACSDGTLKLRNTTVDEFIATLNWW